MMGTVMDCIKNLFIDVEHIPGRHKQATKGPYQQVMYWLMVDVCVQSDVIISPTWKLIVEWIIEGFVNELPKTIVNNLKLRKITSD